MSQPSLSERRITLCADRWAEAAFRATLQCAPKTEAAHGPGDSDVIEVGDLAGAIASAEEAIRGKKLTDDCSGPAVHVPASATPLAPILVLDEHAFKYPAGRIVGFGERSAEAMRARDLRERRRLLAWVVAGILAPVLLLLVFELCAAFGASLS